MSTDDPLEPEQYVQLKCIHYDMKTYYGEQRLLSDTVSLIDSTECCGIKRKDWECYTKAIIRVPDPEVKLYHQTYLQCLEKSACLKQELQQSKCRDLLCSKQEPLKGDNPTECYIMKKKDGECHMKAKFNAPDPLDYLDSICSNPDLLKLIHPVFHHAGNTAAMFPDETLEVDASIEKGTIFGILGSEKRSEKPMNRIHVCGQTIVKTSMYTTTVR